MACNFFAVTLSLRVSIHNTSRKAPSHCLLLLKRLWDGFKYIRSNLVLESVLLYIID